MSAASLGDQLSSKFKHTHAASKIKPGSVIQCFSDAAGKLKRNVILGVSEDGKQVLTVYFNTNKPFKGGPLHRLQLHVEANGRDYLSHDSYLNCADPEERDFKWLLKWLEKNPDSYMESCSEEDIRRFTNMVAGAETTPPKLIHQYHLDRFKE